LSKDTCSSTAINDYYDCYCYLPLYVFCGRHVLAAKLRRASLETAAGSVEEGARALSPTWQLKPKMQSLAGRRRNVGPPSMRWLQVRQRRFPHPRLLPLLVVSSEPLIGST
jgi:Transposase DDE domain group 1